MVFTFSGRPKLLSQTTAFSSIFFLLLALNKGIVQTGAVENSPGIIRTSMAPTDELHFAFNRKLLDEQPATAGRRSGGGVEQLDRVGEQQCSKDDILVHQQATEPMPDGIPTYTVNVLSTCPERSNCAMAQIHLTCGWFSTARVINPDVLRRVAFNDCLLIGGRPLPSGYSISFQYADTFPYHFSVSSAVCQTR